MAAKRLSSFYPFLGDKINLLKMINFQYEDFCIKKVE